VSRAKFNTLEISNGGCATAQQALRYAAWLI